MKPLISVIIATHNRDKYLEKAIYSLSLQSLAYNEYEVLIIDNASTDKTKEIVEKQISKLNISLSYIYSPEPSANKARNIGWQKALGKYVVFMDDDAIAVPEWLERIVSGFQTVSPSPGIIGGKVVPIWEKEPPDWLNPKLYGALSLIDYSPEKTFLDKKLPFSVNMSFQKTLLAQYGGFDIALGRKGDKLLSGDETAIAIRIRNAGYKVYYDPAIEVGHHIPSSRLDQSWFTKRYYWGGYSDALMWRILEKPTPFRWVKQLCTSIYSFLRNPSHIFYIRKETNNPEVFWFKCIVYARIGYIRGLFDFSKNS
ncbi:glycosyltransferase [Cytophagaceae bacterium YF14B1]|uniref:Glycosyltransferase n=1 Tax=Xanthocytophaga flava TaxID=3048013 RepID=A0AAE3U8Z4_9BACT|nr:glycosyltransferase [Xanthocytophaga flavus]MDJ1483152.1 glycosyltransferase [Xanthocytophaga flavus]